MRLSRLFLMAALVGGVAVIGCDDGNGAGGSGGTGGTGGTGGGGTGGTDEPCTGGECTPGSDAKANCDALLAGCLAGGAGGEGGEGGAGGAGFTPTPEDCRTFAEGAFCIGGAGGAGGAGGEGGAGGDPGLEACNEGSCATNLDKKAICEEFLPACLLWCEGPGSAEACGEDECLGIVLLYCEEI